MTDAAVKTLATFFSTSLLLCSVLAMPLRASGQEIATHGEDHPHIEVDDTLTLEKVLDTALTRAPERAFSPAYRDYADNQRRASRSLIATAPRLTMSYWDDQALDDTGLREMEAGVEMDLWQWGQKQNARQLADSLQTGSDAWQQFLRLMVAGELRDSLHQLAFTEARYTDAQYAVEDARSLLKVSEQLLRTGAIPRAAVMQSEALVLEARQQLLDRAAEKVDAERRYFTLTGLMQRPADFSETAPAGQQREITINHPQLKFLQARRQQQAHIVEQERYRAVDNTTLSVGMRRQRGSALEPDIDSVGLAITIPFGGGSHRNASASAAAVALADADVRLYQAQRALTGQLHEVTHQLEVIRDAIDYAARARDLNRERWQMTRKAFSLGESDIQATILALRAYRQSQLQWQLQTLKQNALISSLKQTLGQLP